MSDSFGERLSALARYPAIEFLWCGVGLAVALALGMANLYYPLGADQAVFLLGARALDQGAVLYVDYWDNKQPALYYFWFLGGRLFGFTEFGIHAFELLWLMLFSLLLIVTLRKLLRFPWLAALAPVSTVGVYYATAGEHQLTQLEILVGLPIYLALWFAYRGVERRERRPLYFFLSGLFAAVVVCFKLLVSGIVLAIWVVATLYVIGRSSRGRWVEVLRCLFPAGLGSAMVIGVVLGIFWHWQALEELLWTAFVYPSAAFESAPPASRSRLVTLAAFYLTNTGPWLLFAGLAIRVWLRERSTVFSALLLAWSGAAVLVIAIQNFSWWEYHALLLIVPTGLLAVLGIDRVVAFVADLREPPVPLAMLGSLVISLPLVASLLGPFLNKAKPLISELLIQRHGLQAYQWKVSEHYRDLWRSTRFLSRPEALPGPIYAFGNAMVYPFSGRACAQEIAGSAWEFYLPAQMEHILETLRRDRVPYIFIDKNDDKITWMRPKIWSFLQTDYELYRTDEAGRWFRWRGPRLSVDD